VHNFFGFYIGFYLGDIGPTQLRTAEQEDVWSFGVRFKQDLLRGNLLLGFTQLESGYFR